MKLKFTLKHLNLNISIYLKYNLYESMHFSAIDYFEQVLENRRI